MALPLTPNTSSKPLSASPKSPTRKRGGQAGNKNARKHGFYSHTYTEAEKLELSQTKHSYRENNIKFFKVIIARTSERIKPSTDNLMTFQENVFALHTVIMAISRLLSAVNKKHDISSPANKNEKEIVEFYRGIGWSQEQIDNELFVNTSQNKRGGQVGNLNALKHGFYSSLYSPRELRKLDKLENEDDLIEESALLQILMKRVFAGLTKDLPLIDFLKAVRVLSYADACYEKLNRGKGLLLDGKSLQDLIMEAIHELNIEQGLVP